MTCFVPQSHPAFLWLITFLSLYFILINCLLASKIEKGQLLLPSVWSYLFQTEEHQAKGFSWGNGLLSTREDVECMASWEKRETRPSTVKVGHCFNSWQHAHLVSDSSVTRKELPSLRIGAPPPAGHLSLPFQLAFLEPAHRPGHCGAQQAFVTADMK